MFGVKVLNMGYAKMEVSSQRLLDITLFQLCQLNQNTFLGDQTFPYFRSSRWDVERIGANHRARESSQCRVRPRNTPCITTLLLCGVVWGLNTISNTNPVLNLSLAKCQSFGALVECRRARLRRTKIRSIYKDNFGRKPFSPEVNGVVITGWRQNKLVAALLVK